MIFENIENVNKYNYLKEKFNKAFEFLQNTDLKSLEVGKIEIIPNEVFAVVKEYETENSDKLFLEKHVEYIDLQYVVEGIEKIQVTQDLDLKEKTPYNKENDIQYYFDCENLSEVILKPNDFLCLFPEEGHKPQCSVESPSFVKKIVIKIKI